MGEMGGGEERGLTGGGLVREEWMWVDRVYHLPWSVLAGRRGGRRVTIAHLETRRT